MSSETHIILGAVFWQVVIPIYVHGQTLFRRTLHYHKANIQKLLFSY